MLLPRTIARKWLDRVLSNNNNACRSLSTTTGIAMRKDRMKSRKRRSTREGNGEADEDPRGAMERGASAVPFEHESHVEQRALVQSCSTTLDPYTVLPLRCYRSAGSSREVPWTRLADSDANVPPCSTRRLRAESSRARREVASRAFLACTSSTFYFSLWLVTYQTTSSRQPEASSPEHVSNIDHAPGSGRGVPSPTFQSLCNEKFARSAIYAKVRR